MLPVTVCCYPLGQHKDASLAEANKEAASWKYVRLCPQSSHGITDNNYDGQLPFLISIFLE